MNETFCVQSVTYITTVEPSGGNVTIINETTHNITGLKGSTIYSITTTVVLRGSNRVYNATLKKSTLEPTSKLVAINIHHICDRICENHPFGHTIFGHKF